jgi:hypothetical protein
MTLLWQHIIVIAALVIAGIYLVWHFRKGRHTEPGCKSCGAVDALTKRESKS